MDQPVMQQGCRVLPVAIALGIAVCGCSRTPTVRAAPARQAPKEASGVPAPAQPTTGAEGAPAGLLARLPGLVISRIYYQDASAFACYLECLGVEGPKPVLRELFKSPGDQSLEDYAVSPDEHYAAVVVRSEGDVGNSDITNLRLVDLTNGRVSDLTTDWAGYSGPTWSSDSQALAYVSAEGETEGTSTPPPDRERKLPPWTVYCRALSAAGRVRLFRQVPTLDDADLRRWGGPTWLPGRRTLLYASVKPRGVFLLRAGGGDPLLLTQRIPFDLDLASRRGAWFDAITRTVSIFSLPAEAAALERPATWRSPRILATVRLPTDRFALAFSADGRRVVACLRWSIGGPQGQHLAVVDLAQRTVRAFGRREPTGEVRWSRDGRYLLWEQRTPRDAGNLSELVAVRSDAAPAQPLASADWWRESGVQPTVLVRLTTEWANQLRWVEGK